MVGATHDVLKPFAPRDLVEQILDSLRPRRAPPARRKAGKTMRVGVFQLLVERQAVRYQAAEIPTRHVHSAGNFTEGLSMDDSVWVPTVFTKNRERLIEHDAVVAFFNEVLKQADKKRWLSKEHFSVDGTLIQAWAGHKSFVHIRRPQHAPVTGQFEDVVSLVHKG
jgi:hypothetical protein